MKVLIVDDTKILRKMLMDILIEFCNVKEDNIFMATDGLQGVSEYKRLRPDVVFLDILMPNLNGKEAVKEIIQINPDANIIMCTSDGASGVVKECISAGAKDYLVKPLMPQRVSEAVKKVLGE